MPDSRSWTDGDASRLKALRQAQGWDLPALARRSALSVTQVRQLEEGGDSAFYSPDIKCMAGRRLLERLEAASGLTGSGDNAPKEA